MNILHIYKSYYPETLGGVEQMVQTLSKGLLAQGLTCEVLVMANPELCDAGPALVHWEGIRIHRVARQINLASTPIGWRLLPKLAQLAPQFDLLHFHFPYPWADVAWLYARLTKQLRIPYLVSYHSDIVKQQTMLSLYRPLMKYFLSGAKVIVAASPQYAQTSAVLQSPLLAHKVNIVPYGIAAASVNEQHLKAMRQRVGEGFFLFLGVLRYYKGLHTLLEAAKNVASPIVLAGTGPMESALKTQAQTLGLSNIHFLGAVSDDDKTALLHLCKAFVFPSHLRSEAFGISLLEAAAHGKPLISCSIGSGMSYINLDQTTGLEIPPEDSPALAKAMNLLHEDEGLRTTFGHNARLRYESLFTQPQMVQAYASIYRAMLSTNGNI